MVDPCLVVKEVDIVLGRAVSCLWGVACPGCSRRDLPCRRTPHVESPIFCSCAVGFGQVRRTDKVDGSESKFVNLGKDAKKYKVTNRFHARALCLTLGTRGAGFLSCAQKMGPLHVCAAVVS